MIEFEMKFETTHDKIRHKLEEMHATFIRNDYNYDQYYNHPMRDFTLTDEALRIRQTSSETCITYKGPKLGKRTKTREELEIEVESEEMGKILEKLGFTPAGVVNKKRETWKLNDFTITLDEVEELGDYVEIEIMGPESADREEVIDQLDEFVRKLGLNPKQEIRTSYLNLLEQMRRLQTSNL